MKPHRIVEMQTLNSKRYLILLQDDAGKREYLTEPNSSTLQSFACRFSAERVAQEMLRQLAAAEKGTK